MPFRRIRPAPLSAMPEENQGPLSFPCAFPVKVMGEADASFETCILEIVQRHAPDYDTSTLETRRSRGGKYISLTCTINAVSKSQLDALYRELSAHPRIKAAL
jgi:putative lipoic acid-binding regulatory protein